ncbi:MAG: NADPH-dependent F420 reductase [Candidatus Bathyarchaeia archaeon]
MVRKIGPRTIALVGGTGNQGPPLAVRWALAGNSVLIGSRSLEKAQSVAGELEGTLREMGRGAEVGFGVNEDIVGEADTVVFTIPYGGLEATLEKLKERIKPGTLVISPIVPIEFRGKEIRLIHVDEGSAAEIMARSLPQAKVVAALHTVSADLLADYSKPVEGDVIVCGDDREARRVGMVLVEEIPNLRAVDGGGLENAHMIEEFTVLLIKVGRINRKPDLGIKLI